MKIFLNEDRRRLLSNFISLTILRGFQFLIPLITLPYLIRTLGIENFGLVNFAISFGIYFGALIQFGFGITATRAIARNRDNEVSVEGIYSVTVTASLILAFFSSLLYILIVCSVDKFYNQFELYVYTLMFVLFNNVFPAWLFQGLEKMKYIAVLNLFSNFLFLTMLVVVIKASSDYIYVPLLYSISSMFMLVVTFFIIRFNFKIKYTFPKTKDLISLYKESYHAFLSQLAPNLYNNSAVFLLGVFSSNSAVGLFSAAAKIIDAVASFSYILSNTFLPYLSRNLDNHKYFSKIMWFSGVFLTIFLACSAEWIVLQLFKLNDVELVCYVRSLSVSVLMIFVGMTYGNNYLMLTGDDRHVRNINVLVSVMFFAMSFILVPTFGVWGSIAILIGARFSIALFIYLRYLKCIRDIK